MSNRIAYVLAVLVFASPAGQTSTAPGDSERNAAEDQKGPGSDGHGGY